MHIFSAPQARDHATKPHTAHLIKKDHTPYNYDPLSRRALIQTNINLTLNLYMINPVM